jgi:hypothetical protein
MTNQQQAAKQIEIVLAQLLTKKKAIGSYVNHVKTEDGDFLVTLTAGKIRLYHAELVSPEQLPLNRMDDILARFVPEK